MTFDIKQNLTPANKQEALDKSNSVLWRFHEGYATFMFFLETWNITGTDSLELAHIYGKKVFDIVKSRIAIIGFEKSVESKLSMRNVTARAETN